MKNKKGFTLIELLAVIIILAVIALIATPVVLNVVDNARKEANKNSVYGLLDSAKLYYAESLLDTTKTSDGKTNVYDKINVSGDKPEGGIVYVKNTGEVAIAVVYDNVCYKKEFTDKEISESEDTENCSVKTSEDNVVTPSGSYKCIRATVLHEETCSQETNYCAGSGYSNGSTIKYGNEIITPEHLNPGDAFDCDVDGTGYNHRFYYVSDLESNSEYAVLVYYNNTTAGVADNTSSSLIAYDSSNRNYEGPVTAIANLPTETQWSNIRLSSISRAITTETGTTSTNGGNLPTEFSYSKDVDGVTVPLAARLLTYQEVAAACGGDGNLTSSGKLDGCNYLIENTKYSSNSLGTYGYWLETPYASYSSIVWYVLGFNRSVYHSTAYFTSDYGVRPAIEVLKTDIEI